MPALDPALGDQPFQGPAQGVSVDAEAFCKRGLRRQRITGAVQRSDLGFELSLDLSVDGLAGATLNHFVSRCLDI